MQWQSIETAPRLKPDDTGPYILFHEPDLGDGFVFQGWLDEEGECWACGCPYGGATGFTPTHWMLIPAPPVD